jgi:hypothetical protein
MAGAGIGVCEVIRQSITAYYQNGAEQKMAFRNLTGTPGRELIARVYSYSVETEFQCIWQVLDIG